MADLQALEREVDEAAMQMRTIARIRVTEVGLRGSIVAVPMPESELQELLVHPEDWRGVLADIRCSPGVKGPVGELLGIPVFRESRGG